MSIDEWASPRCPCGGAGWLPGQIDWHHQTGLDGVARILMALHLKCIVCGRERVNKYLATSRADTSDEARLRLDREFSVAFAEKLVEKRPE